MNAMIARGFLLLLILPLAVYAQITQVPNGDFESWSGNTPTGWFTGNAGGIDPVTPSTTSFTGSLSMRGSVLSPFPGSAVPPYAITQTLPNGFAVDRQAQYLTGFFQYTPVGGDQLTIQVGMTKNGGAVGGGQIMISQARSGWTRFIVDINYMSDGPQHTPDHCVIPITIFNTPQTHAASTFLIDNLALGSTKVYSSFVFEDSIAVFDPPNAVVSQNILDRGGTAEAADDFVIPPGERWVLQAVEILGAFSRAGQGFQSATVNIRADDNNRPGAVIFTDTTFINNGPNFYVVFSDTIGLNPGRYWLNFLVNMPMGIDSSLFAWATTPTSHGAAFQWRDPANIFGRNLPQWSAGNQSGVGGGHPDLVFELVGFNHASTDVRPISSELPTQFSLSQNFPNPFNPTTHIEFRVPARTTQAGGQGSGFVSLRIFDVLGREVALLVNQHLPPGSYRANWNADEFPSGVYFYTLNDGRESLTKRMILTK
ncbi:MAG: T9SS type A sorting domain-containing protein [Ignavibacteriae bacterium]|nr:T9SS type A sorting domain-containing protein [Ignavibacteriota bacterium]